MTRHTTTGNARPWEVAKGYRYTTRPELPLLGIDRPAGEPSLLVGALIVLSVFGVVAALVLAFGA